MRKRYRVKRRACALCKPDKRGGAPRWDDRQLMLLRAWERKRDRIDRHGRGADED
jgi:hypothetical protein